MRASDTRKTWHLNCECEQKTKIIRTMSSIFQIVVTEHVVVAATDDRPEIFPPATTAISFFDGM